MALTRTQSEGSSGFVCCLSGLSGLLPAACCRAELMGGLGYVPYSNTTVQGKVEAEVEGSEGATVSRPLLRPQARRFD